MPGERFKAEEVVNKLRQADVELARGSTVASVCKLLGITDATNFSWRKEYGGMKVVTSASAKVIY
jgi:putative transposase